MSPATEIYLNILLLFLITLQIFVAQISNYSVESYLLKFIILIILCPLFVLLLRLYKLNFFFIIKIINSKIKIILLILIFFPLITLLYSKNPHFGLLKWINLIIGLIPSIILVYYVKEFVNTNTLKIFFKVLAVISSLIILITLIKKPFTYSGFYDITRYEFSHVIFARFIAPITLYTYYNLLISRKLITLIYYTFLSLFMLTSIIYTSHRATTIGIFITLFFLFYLLNRMKYSSKLNNIFFILTIIVSFTISMSFNLMGNRNYELINYLIKNKTTDASINTRLELYKISFELIKENPVTGIGFGGFNSYYKSDLPIKLKYPHNLFLETQVELGIIGSILLITLIYLTLKNTIKYSKLIFIFALFSLWLALFSKDLSTQNLLFINIIFINRNRYHH